MSTSHTAGTPPLAPLGPRATWCFSTLGCPESGWEEIVGLARDFGVPGVELRALSGELHLPTIFEHRWSRPEAFAAAARDAQLAIPVIDTSYALANDSPDARECLLSFVPWAEAVGTPWLRVFDGGKFEQELSAETVERMANAVAWWRGARRSGGWQVDVIVETHDALCASAHCSRFQEALGGDAVGLLWDSWHIWNKNGEPLETTWAVIAPWVRHIHVKDGMRTRVPPELRLPGSGDFPWAHLAQLLRRDQWTGSVCLEWERKWHPHLPPLREAMGHLARVCERLAT